MQGKWSGRWLGKWLGRTPDEESTSNSAWGISWGDSWGNSWGAFTTPFQKLDFSKQLFVRSALNTLYTKSAVEQIVAYASTENISVMEALQQLTVRFDPVEQTVSTHRERPAIYSPPALREVVSISAPVTSEISDQQKSITVFQTTPSTFVYASQEVVTVTDTARQVWVKTEFGSGVTVYLQPVNRGTIGI